MKIVPTLLTTAINDLKNQLILFQNIFERIQLDIADAKLVPNFTTQINDLIDLVKENDKLLNRNIVLDFHLMVENFEPEFEKIKELEKLGVKIGVVLINSKFNVDHQKLEEIFGLKIGLDFFPESDIEEVINTSNMNNFSSVQIMTVSPGFQGSPFLPEMLKKITILKRLGYRGEILIDGGVNNLTISQINKNLYKPDILCVGSYLTKEDNLTKILEKNNILKNEN